MSEAPFNLPLLRKLACGVWMVIDVAGDPVFSGTEAQCDFFITAVNSLAERDADERVSLAHMGETLEEVEAVENALHTYCERLADEVGRLRAALEGTAQRLCIASCFIAMDGKTTHAITCVEARAALEPKP